MYALRGNQNVKTFIMEAGVELLWLFLSGIVEIQAQVGVKPQTKVVVHHKDLHKWKIYKDQHQHSFS